MRINTYQIKLLLAEQRLTQEKLAAAADLSSQGISLILKRGSCRPSNLGRIANVLGVSVSEISADE